MSAEETLQHLGYPLPAAAKPVANYVLAVQTGNLVFCSGQLPTRDGKLVWQGQIGDQITEAEGYDAAHLAALNCLAAIRSAIGDLDRIKRIVRVTGYVSGTPEFVNHAAVINGASDLLVLVFGEAGKHSRAAIGVFRLPLDAPVEVDMIVEVTD